MMTFVMLGWIQDIIDWVFDKILNPVFKWLSDLLSDVFKWVFDNVLGPILETVFTVVAETVGKLIMRLLGRYLYIIEKCLLSILDMMQDIFDVLAGAKTVKDNTLGLEGSLITILVRSPFVSRTLALVTAVSVVLVFFFAIVATIRSIGDMGGPRSQSVGQVLRNLAHALLRMVSAPFFGLMMVMLGDAVLVAITIAMTQGTNTTIARSLFTISTLDAVEDEYAAYDKDGKKYEYKSSERSKNPVMGYNYSTRSEWLAKHPGDAADYGLMDKFREPFYTGTKDYMDTEVVEKTFNFGRMNFLVGIGGTMLFIYVIGSSLFVFVSRLFDVLILLIIEPFFLAPMPLDDGEHFKKWEDMFIAKLFSGYGMVVAMYLYLLICSMVFDGRIAFTAGGEIGDIIMDMLMRIVLLLGGAMTMMTAGPLVTSILNSAAAGQESQALQAGQAFTDKAMTPLKFATKKAVMEGAKFFTGGKHGLVAQAEKLYNKGSGAVQQFTGSLGGKGGGQGGPGGGQGGPGGGQGGFGGGQRGAGDGQGYPGGQGSAPGQGGYGAPGGMAVTGYQTVGYQTVGYQTVGYQAVPAPGQGESQRPPGAPGAAPPAGGAQAFTGGRQGAAQTSGAGQSETAGAGQDDFDTVFDVGGRSLFDEEAPGAGQSETAGAGQDDFDTVFDVGGRSLFDEEAPGAGQSETAGAGQDDFDTVFDVGGKSLFDEEAPGGGDGSAGAAANDAGGAASAGDGAQTAQNSGGRRRIDNRLGYAWRTKASPEAIAAVKRKYGIPDRNPDGSIKTGTGAGKTPDGGQNMSMEDIVGGAEPAEDEINFDTLFNGSINDTDDTDGSDGDGKF